ncbi:hypothetical protein DFH06DRAFT_1481635 [Mycena polygramma]|nr:hypothetical protein DFH06DRAFT_1481635 [Mycena polygramma]
MSLSSDQANSLLQLARDARLTEYLALASLSLVIFEWLISLRREVDMVWMRPKSPVKWLYVSNRYFTFAMIFFCTYVYLQETPSDTSCFISQQVQGIGATMVVGTVDIILLLRIWILCERSRRVFYVLLPMVTGEIAMMLCITILTVNSLTEFVHVGFVTGCYSPDVPKYFAAFPVPSLIVSCLMFCVTVRICYRRLASSHSACNTQSIVKVFLRDGVLWFLVVVLINPPQIVLWGWARPTLIQVLMMPSLA